jgi:anthranilate 1,2-dioxygenase small subunit
MTPASEMSASDIERAAMRPEALSPEARALTLEVRELYEELADLLDDDQVERMPAYFTDDCLYQVISKENHDEGLPQATIYCDGIQMLRDRIVALRETQVYEPRAWRHFISGVRVIATTGEDIVSRGNFLVTESMSDAEPTVLLVGRYLDRLVRREGRLMFRERLAVYDNYRVVRSMIVPV